MISGATAPTATLATDVPVRVGAPVIAIGSSLSIEGLPLVSALKRAMEQPGLPMLHSLIQTDAAIKEGNSGGPLVDRSDNVIGINTALIPSAHGIAIAIPATVARPVLREIIARGSILRPDLGVTGFSVTPQLAFADDLQATPGVLIVTLHPTDPGARAALQRGTWSSRSMGHATKGLQRFYERLWQRRPGEPVTLLIERDAFRMTVHAVLRYGPTVARGTAQSRQNAISVYRDAS